MKKTSHAAEVYFAGINQRIADLENTAISMRSFAKQSAVPELIYQSSKKFKLLDDAIAAGKRVEKYAYATVSLSDKGTVCLTKLQ